MLVGFPLSQATARTEAAEKALRDATKQGQRLRDQNEGMVSELQVIVRARRRDAKGTMRSNS